MASTNALVAAAVGEAKAHPEAVAQDVRRARPTDVLDIGDHELVARSPVDPPERVVHAVGGPAGQGDLRRGAAEELRDVSPEQRCDLFVFWCFCEPRPAELEVAALSRSHRLEDGKRERAV